MLEQPAKRQTAQTLVNLGFFLFVCLLFIGQVSAGTSALFAFLVSTFCIFSFATIKLLGGISTLQGAAVFVLCGQHVIFSQFAKALFRQPADTPLLRPIETILVYNLGILSIFVAALSLKVFRIDRIKPILDIETDPKVLRIMMIILSALAIARLFILQRFGVYEGAGGGVYVGGFVGPLRQFGFITPLGLACGTAYVILKSDRQKCLGPWNTAVVIFATLFGILGAGRAEIIGSAVTFFLTLIAFRFKLRWHHFVIGIVGFYLYQFILFPYALYARGEGKVREGSFDDRISKSLNILVDVAVNPDKYKEKEKTFDPYLPYSFRRMYYYGYPRPTLDRYSVIIATDNIVNAVLVKGPTNWENAFEGFKMILPRFLNPEKEALGSSNHLAHYGDGLVGETDFFTQITLGIIPEGFYSQRWMGVFLACFVVSFAFFTTYRLLFAAQMSRNIYVLSLLFSITWSYSESTMQGQTLNIFQTPVYYVCAVYPILLFAKSMTRKVKEADFIYVKGMQSQPTNVSEVKTST